MGRSNDHITPSRVVPMYLHSILQLIAGQTHVGDRINHPAWCLPLCMRGKLGGLFNTAESLARFLGPAGYSITYAWSVSASTLQAYYGGWVHYRFVF